MSTSKPKNTLERELLAETHSKERTDELLEERYSINGRQTPFLSVTATQGTIAQNKQRQEKQKLRKKAKTKGKFHIQTARKALKSYLFDLRHHTLTLSYNDCLSMFDLWISYINDLLGNTTDKKIIAGKLASADFHGSNLKVVRARNATLVGVNGIVIWEARTSFAVITPESCLKYIEKKGTIFRIQGISSDYDLDIIGSRFLYRTADRSGRKFKTHGVDDI